MQETWKKPLVHAVFGRSSEKKRASDVHEKSPTRGNTRKTSKLVKIRWRDVIATAGWEPPEEVDPPVLESWGFLIKKDKNVIKIATTRDEKGEWTAITAFPPGVVLEITTLL